MPLTVKPFLRLFYWFWSPVCTVGSIRACFPKSVPMPQPQRSGSASGLWGTDVSPVPAVTHSSPAFKTKDVFRSFVTHWIFSVPKSLFLGHSQPVSFLHAQPSFNYVRALLVCIIPPSQAFPVLISSCHQILLASMDLYQLWSRRRRLKEGSGAEISREAQVGGLQTMMI